MLEATAFVFMTRPHYTLVPRWFPTLAGRIESSPIHNAADHVSRFLLSLPRLFKTDLLTIPSVTPTCRRPSYERRLYAL